MDLCRYRGPGPPIYVYHISIVPLLLQPFFLCLLYFTLERVYLYAIFPIFYLRNSSFVCAYPTYWCLGDGQLEAPPEEKSGSNFEWLDSNSNHSPVGGQELYHLFGLRRLQECHFCQRELVMFVHKRHVILFFPVNVPVHITHLSKGWFDIRPTSQTLVQHCTSFGGMCYI